MNFHESITQSLDNLTKRKLRSLLTMLGIIFGVGAVISMLSIGAGAEDQALQLIRQMGLRNIIVEGKEHDPEDLRKIREKSLGLSRRDVEALPVGHAQPQARDREKEHQDLPGFFPCGSGPIQGGGRRRRLFLHREPAVARGRFLCDGRDEDGYSQVCVLGASAKQALFGFESAIGDTLKINNVWFSVVGVIADQTLSQDEFQGVKLQNTNNDIYIPLSTALKKLEVKALDSELDGIVLEVESESKIEPTALVVSQLLEKLHNGEPDFSLIVPEQLYRQSRQTQKIFNIVMGCIAGISLLVGGIGIMNIMLANVLERTHEIGIRRAIGARRIDIRLQFLIEAVTISIVGGCMGVALGFAIAALVVYYAGWSTIITTWSIVLAFGVSAE